MKKLLVLLLLVIILAPPVAWKLEGDRTLNLMVVDASVRNEKSRPHAGITWLTKQMHIKGPQGRSYGLNDYFGYFPSARENVRRFDYESLEQTDLLYLADLRGVWRSSQETFEMFRSSGRDELIHSGLSRSEIRAVKEYVESGRTAVAEAFLFYANHEGGEQSREMLEKAFGVKWTGWIGGWFDNLNNGLEVPFWVRALYDQITGQAWNLRGPGVILINPGEGEFMVLTPGVELRESRPHIMITRREGALSHDVESGVPVWGWFEIVEADNPVQIRALVQLTLTAVGQRVLEEKRLPSAFPAVVSQWIERDTYYISVDLSTVPTWLGPSQAKWAPEIRGQLAPLLETQFQGEEPFWRFYIPFLRNLFNELAH